MSSRDVVPERVVIAIDPHKASWTAAAVTASLQPLATLRSTQVISAGHAFVQNLMSAVLGRMAGPRTGLVSSWRRLLRRVLWTADQKRGR